MAILGNEMVKVSEIEKKCVAIVRFGPSGLQTDGFKPGEYFQVTIDPDRCSPSGEFIRFGPEHGHMERGAGDEIIGWQRCDALCVVEVLGEWDGDKPPVMFYGSMGITQVA